MAKCDKCGIPAQHVCPICGNLLCIDDSALSIICKDHIIAEQEKKEVKIRYATEKDEEALEEIEDSVIWEHIKPKNYESTYSSNVWKNLERKSLAAEVERKVVGFVEYVAGVDPHEEQALMVTDLGVLPEYQGIGVGYKLLDKLKEIAKTEGFRKIYASISIDNIPALIFHLKSGARVFSFRETKSKGKGRWGIPPLYSISFMYEV